MGILLQLAQPLIVIAWAAFGYVIFIAVCTTLEGVVHRLITHYYSTKAAYVEKVQNLALQLMTPAPPMDKSYEEVVKSFLKESGMEE